MMTETPQSESTEVRVVEAPPVALTLKAAGEALGISQRSAYRLAERGLIETITVGDGSTRVPYASLVDYIDHLRSKNAHVLQR